MEMIYYESLASSIRGFMAQGIRSLVMTSSGPREGKSTVTAHLGRALAQSGLERVILVDTDWVKPTLHKILGLENTRGLGEILKEVYQVDTGNGNQSQFRLGDWMELLSVQSRTGILQITEGGNRFDIEFKKGRIFNIHWQQRPEDRRLGTLLVEEGRITEDQKETALRVQRERREILGDVFCGLGYLEPSDLESPLRAQNKDCLHKLFTLCDPEVVFSETPEGDEPKVRMVNRGRDDLIPRRFKDSLQQHFLPSRIGSYLQDTDINSLKVLPSGALTYNLLDPVIAQQFKSLLARLTQRSDMVLIDSPPVGLASPAATLAGMADGVVMVVQADRLDVQVVQQAKEELVDARANLLGVILNQVALKRNGGYQYYQGTYAK